MLLPRRSTRAWCGAGHARDRRDASRLFQQVSSSVSRRPCGLRCLLSINEPGLFGRESRGDAPALWQLSRRADRPTLAPNSAIFWVAEFSATGHPRGMREHATGFVSRLLQVAVLALPLSASAVQIVSTTRL